ncbi:MAG: SdrD B-like domain-containing protein [Bacteroidota bacterium]
MKPLYYLSRTIIISGLLLLLSIPMFAAGNVRIVKKKQTQQRSSIQTRQEAAEQQLREYQQQLSNTSRHTGAPGAAGEEKIILGDLQTASKIFFTDDMENGTNGWTIASGNVPPLWHQTTSNYNSPTHSWWVGSESTGTYNVHARVDESLISPAIDLSGSTGNITMMFTEYYVTERGWDFCMVGVSTDAGTSWSELRGGYGNSISGRSNGWKITKLDLTPFAGQTVNIRFHFDTHDSTFNNFPGWFIDNMVVFDQRGFLSGKTFFDVNKDGIENYPDSRLQDWPITVTGEGITLIVKTNDHGRYNLTLPLGTYTVTESLQTGWSQTAPLSGSWTVPLTIPDMHLDTANFGNWHQAALMTGYVFSDSNQNGVRDSGEALIPNWRIGVNNSNGADWVQYTDTSGYYTIVAIDTGLYDINQIDYATTQTYPPDFGGYEVQINNLTQTFSDLYFGNYFGNVNWTGSIVGQVWNDINRNDTLDERESGVAGMVVRIGGQEHRTAVTDSNGYYSFPNLSAGIYSISLDKSVGWWQSYPSDYFVITLGDTVHNDTSNFGMYQIVHSSISGQVFNDLNFNGIKDPGDTGLVNWTVGLKGRSVFGDRFDMTGISDSSGNFRFDSLWPGTYTLTETWQSRWRQTYPKNLKPNIVHVGVEDQHTGVLFGDYHDTTYYVQFRSFLPESLARAKNKPTKWGPVDVRPTKEEFQASFTNTRTPAADAVKLVISFGLAIPDTLSITPWGNQSFDNKRKVVTITFPVGISQNDSVVIHGYLNVAKPQRVVTNSTTRWTFKDLTTGRTSPNYVSNAGIYPMPNAANVLSAGAGDHLKVGLGGSHSVVHSTWKDVGKSLIDNHDMHAGLPRCLSTYASNSRSPISTQLHYLTPTKGNNVLFSEAIALQTNIRASELEITPFGFGDLIFDEGGTDPFNGKSINFIAGKLDEYMSSSKNTPSRKGCVMPAGYESLDSLGLYRIIRMIDSSFSGPMDTVQFANGLIVKWVRPITDVPYLHLDSSFAAMGGMKPAVAPIMELPKRFALNQNYPNPFNPATTISFTLPQTGFVTLKIYNMLGQEVKTLLRNENMEQGTQHVEFNASELASGVYFYRLDVNVQANEENGIATMHYSSVKKMMLVK